ncbi:MAG: hypothetical protein ACRDXE_08960, partial [Acidimicrobiales bacterium]
MPGVDHVAGRWRVRLRPTPVSAPTSGAAALTDPGVDVRPPVLARLSGLLYRIPLIDRTREVWWQARWDGAVVALLVTFAALLRVVNLGRGYWVDEGISIGIASHPVDQIPHLLRLDGSPPLFYL